MNLNNHRETPEHLRNISLTRADLYLKEHTAQGSFLTNVEEAGKIKTHRKMLYNVYFAFFDLYRMIRSY